VKILRTCRENRHNPSIIRSISSSNIGYILIGSGTRNRRKTITKQKNKQKQKISGDFSTGAQDADNCIAVLNDANACREQGEGVTPPGPPPEGILYLVKDLQIYQLQIYYRIYTSSGDPKSDIRVLSAWIRKASKLMIIYDDNNSTISTCIPSAVYYYY